jgi:predicted Zn finger-like uncharacterized protein
MLIQCHSCNTKYRLNLEQIPRRKTFVRCKSCGTPIYIDPTEEEEPTSGVIPPPAGTAAAAGPGAEPLREDQVLVACPGCNSRYRIAAASVQRPGVKLKCTQCGHLFAPPMQVQPPPAAAAAAGSARVHTVPHAGPAAGARREMPLPDERHMEQLFDDLRPEPAARVSIEPPPGPSYPHETELGTLEDVHFDEEPPAPDAERAYQDAIALDGEEGTLPGTGTIPDEQKFRFFLNPKDYHGSETGMADQPDDTPARRAPPAAGASAEDADVGVGVSADLPELDAGADRPPPPSTEAAQSREEMARIREVVPGQEAKVFTEKRVLAIVAAAAVAILAVTGAWGYWLAATAGERKAYQVQFGQPHQLALKNDLQGHFVTNKASGKRLFVVTGEVQNQFAPESKLRWIRIKGSAFSDPGQSRLLGTTFVYAGNVLEDSQLTQWELPAIKAYYGFTNGRKELNVSIPAGAKVPYQLVFDDVEGEVGRSVAQIVSYQRDGQAVFVDNP